VFAWEQRLGSAADTEALGAALAQNCPWHESVPRTLHLHGDLGSGKTTLTRGLLRALGESGSIISPSYSLIELYSLHRGLVVHVDLYRLNDASEFDALGLADYYQGQTLLLIEWPERAASRLPPADIAFSLLFEGQARRCRAVAGGDPGVSWLERVREHQARAQQDVGRAAETN
jgi:tRNA threonylcarbamoyladenosine biosynthesis protein TsaE